MQLLKSSSIHWPPFYNKHGLILSGFLPSTSTTLYFTFLLQMSLKVISSSFQITLVPLEISPHLISKTTVLNICVHSCKFLLKFHLLLHRSSISDKREISLRLPLAFCYVLLFFTVIFCWFLFVAIYYVVHYEWITVCFHLLKLFQYFQVIFPCRYHSQKSNLYLSTQNCQTSIKNSHIFAGECHYLNHNHI